MDRRMADALDNWITGHYGEDQFKHDGKAECGLCIHYHRDYDSIEPLGECLEYGGNVSPGDPACNDFDYEVE